MRILVASVGRPKDRRLTALHDDWADRIRRMGVSYETRVVPETKAGSRYSDAHVREREGAALTAAVAGAGVLVALDPDGEGLTSEALAERLPRWGVPRVAFVIGGPLGLDSGLVERADTALSLSRLTFPHEVARALLAEQIYRALTILRGTPYHK